MSEPTNELPLAKSSRKRRIVAFIIDHFVMTLLMVSIVFLALGPNFIDENNPKISITILAVMIPGFLLYFAKDCYKGISVGKWIMGIMVRDESSPAEIPSFGRLFLRNLFMIIWPIEFLVLATSGQKKRLGDRIAKTIVVKNQNKPSKLPRVLALAGVGVIYFIFIFFFVASAMKNSGAYKIAIAGIEQDAEIKTETGGITGYGMLPAGNISVSDGQGQAQLEIKVLGNKRNMDVSVYLEKGPSGQWQLIEMKKIKTSADR